MDGRTKQWFGDCRILWRSYVGALDQSGKTTGTGNWATSSLTTKAANEILVAWATAGGDLLTTTSPFTQRLVVDFGAGSHYPQIADRLVAPTAAYQATGTGSGNYVTFLAT